ncbi:hypothetical protein ADEAN_000905000 [Angomonas deanei]|uniref:WD domain, G-beta repeat n=1 Tax=Angomonas deanei TaxID=59799 RepID=A0A7G2CNU1_9TRYP|nr:hypothetical protein ADEAN_000905000 [Angomonas deanei]
MDGKDLHGVVKRHVFGIRAEVKSCVQWLDDNTLLYPAGALLTLHNLNSNNQRFIESTYQCTGITAVAVSANKKFIAFAESGENPQVQIIDVVTRKRRKVLSVADVGSDRFVSLAFSADGRHLVTQGGAPEWNMYYWNWERSKPLAIVPLASMRSMAEVGAGTTAAEDLTSQLVSTSFSRHVRSANGSGEQLVTAVSVCPSDPLLVTVSGIGMMRYYRYTDGGAAAAIRGRLRQRNTRYVYYASLGHRGLCRRLYPPGRYDCHQ